MTEEEMNGLMEMLERTHKNAINYTEFVGAAMNKAECLHEDRILKCFRMFDKDGNGKISVQEFRSMIEGSTPINPDVLKKMI